MGKTYDSLYFFSFKADYQDGRKADVFIDLGDRNYTLQISRDNRVESEEQFIPLRRRKIEALRQGLETLGLLSWKSIPFGGPYHFDGIVTFAYDFDEELDEGIDESVLKKHIPKDVLPKLHKLVEETIGTTFGSYQVYQD